MENQKCQKTGQQLSKAPKLFRPKHSEPGLLQQAFRQVVPMQKLASPPTFHLAD